MILDSRGGSRRRYFYMPLSDVYSYAMITKDVREGCGSVWESLCVCRKILESKNFVRIRTALTGIAFLDVYS